MSSRLDDSVGIVPCLRASGGTSFPKPTITSSSISVSVAINDDECEIGSQGNRALFFFFYRRENMHVDIISVSALRLEGRNKTFLLSTITRNNGNNRTSSKLKSRPLWRSIFIHQMTTSEVSARSKSEHYVPPSAFAKHNEKRGLTKNEVRMAYYRHVQEATNAHIRKKLLKDSTFFAKNPCRQLPKFNPIGT
jgi:hypothetical protein